MKVYIMTDMEGVAGVVSSEDYCNPTSRYYEVGRELTTLEVNAAIEGARDAGATEFLVCDGHGWGAIDPVKLHPAARLLTGRPYNYPCGADATFDAAFMIGQHAKANTDGGHLCHSGSFRVIDYELNGRSLGELGVVSLMVGYFNVPMVFVSGDRACCAEARSIIPGIETVAVKDGLSRGTQDDSLTTEQSRAFNGAAIHVHPVVAREGIRAGARRAIERHHEIERFWIEPPYEVIRQLRPDDDGRPAETRRRTGLDLIEVLNGAES